jgi:hypothetical protein
MTTDAQYTFLSERIGEFQIEIATLKHRIFGDSREANGDSLNRKIQRSIDDTKTLNDRFVADTHNIKIELARIKLLLAIGFVANIFILIGLGYLLIEVISP